MEVPIRYTRAGNKAPKISIAADASAHIDGATPGKEQDGKRPKGLTVREEQVLILVARGRTNNEVARELVLSIRAVERHIGNIYSKIRARGRADATVFALTNGLV